MRQQVKLIAAFATVYLVWGSTYLAIKLAVTTFPPFSMMGSRFLIAGAVLYLIGRRSHQPLRWRDLVAPTVLALTMIVFGTGIVGWVEQFIPSGLTALLVSISPFFLVLLEAMRSQGSRPGRLGLAGLAVGLLGTIMLIGPGAFSGTVRYWAVAVLFFSSLSWCVGTIYARHTTLPLSPRQTTSLQMLIGGGMLMVWGGLMGEWSLLAVAPSWSSLGAWFYLISAGSVLVFPTYLWLVKNTTPALVGTHAYVNPVVALGLGWLIAGEVINQRILISGAVIILAVVMISLDQTRGRRGNRTPIESQPDSMAPATET